MIENKINATIILPGRVVEAEPVKLKIGKMNEEEKKAYFNSHYQETVHLNKKEHIVLTFKKPKPASQNIKLSLEAYQYMISMESKPIDMSKAEWSSYSKNKKVKYHLSVIADSLGGKLGEFSILND